MDGWIERMQRELDRGTGQEHKVDLGSAQYKIAFFRVSVLLFAH